MNIQYTGLVHTLQTAAVAALIFAACALLPRLNYRSQLAKLPVFGGPATGEKQRQAYLKSAKIIYFSGYEKVSIYYSFDQAMTDRLIVQRLYLPRSIVRRRRHRCGTSQSAARTTKTR